MSDKAEGNKLTRVNSYQWPTGHVGHLSEGQSGALDRFKTLCEEKGYYVPGDDKNPPTHDDETLLRYLRARKFVPQEAFVQFKDTEDWRKENELDKLYETIDIHEYDQTRRLYPQWTGRRDKRGIPFYVYEIGNLDPKDVSVYTNSKDSKKQFAHNKTPWKMLKLFALYENLCRFVLPLCSAIPDRPMSETPISQSNNIVDLSGVGIGKLWNLRNHMSDASKLATAHYPETLDRIFVVGTPSYFSTIWGWARSWFDPITVSKIFILTPKDMTSTLSKYVDIDNIPKKYGGNLDWKFGEMPNLEPGIANSLRWKENIEQNGHKTLPIGPIKWQFDEDGDLVAIAVGTENGKLRDKTIAGLHPDVGTKLLALSPGRAKTKGIDNSTQARLTTTTSTSPALATSDKNMSSDANQNVGKNPRSAVSSSSRAGTYTIPSHENDNEISPLSANGRTGTSTTRFQQQEGTHAEGQMASGTPAITTAGQGDRAALMDPNTVGQAPKEHPLPEQEEEQPSVIEQAKNMAGQAMEQAKELPSTVMSAVGMGGKKEDEPQEQIRKEDPAIDNMAGKNVEEFLRSTTMSKPEG